MKLRLIERCDFRKNELTNYIEILKKRPLKLGADDCVLLINHQEDQLIFIFGFDHAKDTKGEKRMVLRSEKLRLTSEERDAEGNVIRRHIGKWEPLLLANYAERAGIELEGIKRFEDYYKNLVEQKREEADGDAQASRLAGAEARA